MYTKIIEWGLSYLVSQNYQITQLPEIIIETPWSKLVRFSASKDIFYLKQTPADLFIETDVIQVIQKNSLNAPVPKILFKNESLHCFLMHSCGDHSLRTQFKGTLDSQLLMGGLKTYIRIQRSLEQNLEALAAVGVPDWRVNRIPKLFEELLQNEAMLLEEGLTQAEIEKLVTLVPTVHSICEFLSGQKVKETLVNCDFNENNMIVDTSRKQISIVDWGESVISHPFFSIAAHLSATARRYQLDLNGRLLESIKQKSLDMWSDVITQHEIDEIYNAVLRLLPIFSAFGIYRLQVATQNRSKKQQRWFIAGVLRTLVQKY